MTSGLSCVLANNQRWLVARGPLNLTVMRVVQLVDVGCMLVKLFTHGNGS